MDDGETPMNRPHSPKAQAIAPPSEGELSRIAREAVHQPPDPRLDRQLARMIGVMETSEPAAAQPDRPTSRSDVSGSELERLDSRLRRIEMIVAALVVAVGILAAIGSILLFR